MIRLARFEASSLSLSYNASYNDASGSILALSSFFQVSAAFTLLSLCLSLSVSLSLSLSLSLLSETRAPSPCVS